MGYSGIIFNPGDALDGTDKFGQMIDNDDYLKTIADQTSRGLIKYESFTNVAVNSESSEASLISCDIFLKEPRTIKGIFRISSMTYIAATGNNNLKVRVYEDASQKHEFWGKFQTSTGASNPVYEPTIYGGFILPTISSGNHTVSLKGILNTAIPTGFNVWGEIYLFDIGKQISEA